MNIFALDAEPHRAAEYHCDKHVPKMMLEAAQMLSTMVHVLAPNEISSGVDNVGAPILTWRGNKVYKPTHANHPCSKWVQHSRRNALWLTLLGDSLSAQSELRWHKPAYKAHAVANGIGNNLRHLNFSSEEYTPFVMALPKEILALELPPIVSYRLYYASAKRSFAKWERLGKQPYWWDDMVTHADRLQLSLTNLANDGVV